MSDEGDFEEAEPLPGVLWKRLEGWKGEGGKVGSLEDWRTGRECLWSFKGWFGAYLGFPL